MDLAVQPREKLGKSVRSLRKQGLLPAELYGHGIKNVHLSVSFKEFVKVFKEAGSNTLVTLVLGGAKRPALIHDIDKDFLSDEITHVDFYQVKMDEKLKTKVPLEFLGESPAVKEQAGILNKAMTEIEVEALPADLPHRLTVNLAALLELNQSIYVRDVAVPKGAHILVDPETVIATVTPPVAEEVEVVETPVDVTAVKVETEEKKAERTAEKEATKEK